MTQGTEIKTSEIEPSAEPRSPEPPVVRAGDGGIVGRSDTRDMTPSRGSGLEEQVSLVELANVLLKRRRLLVAVPFALAFITAVVVLIIPARFTAITTFIAEEEGSGFQLPAGIAGLASQFGVALPTGSSTSPAFYSDILRSRTIRDQLLLTRFPDPRSDEPGASALLLDLLKIKGDSEAERLEEGRLELEETVKVGVNEQSAMVNVNVETRYPELSADVANRFIDLLETFNLETRQSRAKMQRTFIQGRVGEAEAELRASEDALEDFLERNRRFQGSPELQFEHDRLQRQVTMKQEVFSTLNRQYEEARIEEVNDTPLITVVDVAVPPQEKSSPKRRFAVIFTFVIGAVLAVVLVFGVEFLEAAEESESEDMQEFNRRLSEVSGELRSVISRLRLRGRGRGRRSD